MCVAAAAWSAGCIPPQAPTGPDVLTSDGMIISQQAIQEVVDDDTLSDEEKRQGLRDLGITDESLIDYFVSEF